MRFFSYIIWKGAFFMCLNIFVFCTDERQRYLSQSLYGIKKSPDESMKRQSDYNVWVLPTPLYKYDIAILNERFQKDKPKHGYRHMHRIFIIRYHHQKCKQRIKKQHFHYRAVLQGFFLYDLSGSLQQTIYQNKPHPHLIFPPVPMRE